MLCYAKRGYWLIFCFYFADLTGNDSQKRKLWLRDLIIIAGCRRPTGCLDMHVANHSCLAILKGFNLLRISNGVLLE